MSERTRTLENGAAKRLERSRSDRMVAGVCGGLARYFDIHPAFYRVRCARVARPAWPPRQSTARPSRLQPRPVSARRGEDRVRGEERDRHPHRLLAPAVRERPRQRLDTQGFVRVSTGSEISLLRQFRKSRDQMGRAMWIAAGVFIVLSVALLVYVVVSS